MKNYNNSIGLLQDFYKHGLRTLLKFSNKTTPFAVLNFHWWSLVGSCSACFRSANYRQDNIFKTETDELVWKCGTKTKSNKAKKILQKITHK